MGSRLEELPLFPMNTVLFPYAHLHLHVFDEKYKELVRYCTQYDCPFGVVLIKPAGREGTDPEPYLVGTAVRIVSVHTFDDGRMDVRVRGERRFRVRKFDDSRPYMVGQVEPVVETEIEDTERAEALTVQAREYVQAYVQYHVARLDAKVVSINLPVDPTALSFVIADYLQVEDIEKQRMLETTDTVERLEEMVPILERHILEAKTPPYFRLTREMTDEWITPN